MCVVRGRMVRTSQDHRAERAIGARFIRPTHVIGATAHHRQRAAYTPAFNPHL